ncbi:PASTA domain-containing protein [Melioribacteraceae bacterium 4301-Me]|uniref:PASTA domain-containing protein n=1 Tax=Pyranulibacter aquaticus TaxID=3163344 RepID=UPI00359A5510
MKRPLKKLFFYALGALITITVILVILDDIVMPYYVSGKIYTVPNVVGLNKNVAITKLKELNLNPIIQSARYDEKYSKDEVIFQKPFAGTLVKANRRIYLTISGGEPQIQMPLLVNKSLRDAKITLERIGLKLGKVDSVTSELPVNTIVEQQYPEGKSLSKGDSVNVKISIGPNLGMIRVPNILGKSLEEAARILKQNSLKVGKTTYIYSSTLLPNTVVDQQPSESTLVSVGDSVNVVLTQSKVNDPN